MLTWGIGENGQLGRISISIRHPKAFEGRAALQKDMLGSDDWA